MLTPCRRQSITFMTIHLFRFRFAGTEQYFLIVQWSRAPYIRYAMCMFHPLSLLCIVRVSRTLAQMMSRCWADQFRTTPPLLHVVPVSLEEAGFPQVPAECAETVGRRGKVHDQDVHRTGRRDKSMIRQTKSNVHQTSRGEKGQ